MERFDKYVDWNTTEGKIIEGLLMWLSDEDINRFCEIYEL
jgi:hypothetical protein